MRRPQALSLSLILEEGLPADELRAQVEAIAAAAEAADVEIATGDTKVVERGHADGMYICTAGIGKIDPRAQLSPRGLRPGDRILVSGTVGDHGSAIMLARDEFSLDAEIISDTRPLWPAVDALLDAAGAELHCMRDATRGGVASVLNELARASGVAISVREADVPVNPAVAGAAEMLGHRPDVRRQRGKAGRLRRARIGREAALAALRSVPGLRGRGGDRRGEGRAAGDGARRDRIRRQAGHGPAGRRPASQDLLKLDNP